MATLDHTEAAGEITPRAWTLPENLNKRARRYLPRDTPMAALSERSLKAICYRLNATPRKCLGYSTPAEAFRDELERLTYSEMSQPTVSLHKRRATTQELPDPPLLERNSTGS